MSSSVGMIIPKIWEQKNPNHQPDNGYTTIFRQTAVAMPSTLLAFDTKPWGAQGTCYLAGGNPGDPWDEYFLIPDRMECLYELNFEYQQIYVNTNLIYIWLNHKIWLMYESLNLYFYFWIIPTNNTIMFCWFVNFGTFSLESIIFPNQSHENWIGT